MTKGEREDFREMLSDILAGHTQNIEGKFNVINTQLDQIKEQTTKTNGRVNKLEEKVQTLEKRDLEHVINCPIAERVKMLETDNTGTKSIKHFVIQSIIIAGIIGGILFGIFEILNR